LTNVEHLFDSWVERPGEVIHTCQFLLTELDPCLKTLYRAFVRQIHVKMQYFTSKINEDHSKQTKIQQYQILFQFINGHSKHTSPI